MRHCPLHPDDHLSATPVVACPDVVEGVGRLVDRELRRAAVEALGALARSADYRDRADAGHALAAFAELPEAHGPLLELVLDPGDTYATRVTAGALLRRRDRLGLTAVASALTVAGPNHGDWIQTAVLDVFGVFSDERDDAIRLCGELSQDPDGRVARELRDLLAGIHPS